MPVRQLALVAVMCGLSLATSLFAEEVRRAELAHPPKKSATEEPLRAIPVSAVDRNEIASVAKREMPSVEIDLGAKKEISAPAKKEISAMDRKVVSVARQEVSAIEKKESAAEKKEVSPVAKKDLNPSAKKDNPASEKKELSAIAKKDVSLAEKKNITSSDKKESSSLAKKEVSKPEKKEFSAAEKKEIIAQARKEEALAKKEIAQPATKEIASLDKKETSAKPAKEFTFKDPKGKTVTAEVVDQYQKSRIVYPLAKVERQVNSSLVRAASIAQDRARAHSKSACWHYVKTALVASGAIASYPKSVYAKQAGEELVRDYGFKKLPIHDPYKAPIGAVLVYGGKGAGHVEIRDKTGFVSDFRAPKPSKRKLIGVYAKA